MERSDTTVKKHPYFLKLFMLIVSYVIMLSGCSITDEMPTPSIVDVAVSTNSAVTDYSASVSEHIVDEAHSSKSNEYCVDEQGGLPFYSKISMDFIGNFTIVAYCWDGYNYDENIGPKNKGGEMNADVMDGYIDPASCIGYRVCFVSADVGYDTHLSLNDMTRVFLVQNSDVGVYHVLNQQYPDVMAVVAVLSRYVNLAKSLDLSEEYMLHWSNNGEFYTFKLARDAFPELSRDSDMRRYIEYAIDSILVLDENHLLLAPGIWNLLAVRDSHLEEGCNYMTIHGNDLIFSRNIP